MPVGRFVLDVHGESCNTWASSDRLCAALQVINHVQDCGMDYRRLNRVYMPLNTLNGAGITVEALGDAKASPALRRCFEAISRQIYQLLREADPLTAQVKDLRLGLEISVIRRLAWALTDRLSRLDPLSERTHLSGAEIMRLSILGISQGLGRRAMTRRRLQAPA
jgi:phytoene/squalene synthetase